MKCCACDEKAEIVLKKLRTSEKTPYCRFHWKMLCLQETVKLFKMNQFSIEEFGKVIDKTIDLQDFFSHLTKH